MKGLGTYSRSNARRVSCQASGAKHAFIFGVGGYTSIAMGNILHSRGWRVSGTYRSEASAEKLRQRKPWDLVHFDPCRRPGFISDELLDALSRSSHVLSSIPPIALPLYDPVLAAQLKALRSVHTQFDWVGNLSSTGVYGDYGGNWVDERSEPRSLSTRGFVRREHEAAWAAAAAAAARPSLPLHIFRLGGIYGPGRSVLESIRRQDGMAVGKEGSGNQQRRGRQKFTSRCHVSDICSAVIASMERAWPVLPEDAASFARPPSDESGPASKEMNEGGESSARDTAALPLDAADITCIVDDDPAPRFQVVAYTQALLANTRLPGSSGQAPADVQHPGFLSSTSTRECPQPSWSPFSQSHLPAGQSEASGSVGLDGRGSQERSSRAEGMEEKRVSNAKMKRELLPELQYPSYREGMQAIVGGNLHPFDRTDLIHLGLL
ncbi:hypothetical protein DUNSADRAFT_9605 [Dunaliella salina]|uniref:Uncharacterized protein n=1 Tax=Dunaliella salina TaxID=3046 RepID=A0ABQ7H5A4_DUNSA|nr:hypothetical protein DUNSADRAFT_9605 [Dunaliella salina]|eukprot:KAF5842036.1 hypothetical protein DUNSADRAFT_9605 [Dunaliella salina]